VTDNVGQFLGYSPSQWADESIYNFLDVADHALFSQALLPLSGGKCSTAVAVFPLTLSDYQPPERRGSLV